VKTSKKVNLIQLTNISGKIKKIDIYKSKKISINMYIYLIYIYKYILLKDYFNNNFKFLMNFFNINVYSNYIECRFYYLFFFILLKSDIFGFIKYIYKFGYYKNNWSSFQYIPEKYLQFTKKNIKEDFFKKNLPLFFYNNKIFIIILLLCKYYFWILYFSKYKYYKNIKKLNKIFFFNEFILKIENTSFFLYRKYIEYFRIVKYNEYLSNSLILFKYPKLRLFLRYSIHKIDLDRVYRKNILIFSCLIYKLNISNDNTKFFCYNNLETYLVKFFNSNLKFDYNIFNKSINQYNEKNFLRLMRGYSSKIMNISKIDNEFIVSKFLNLNIFKFLNLFNSFFYFKFINIFKSLMCIYLSYISYEVYHKYILLNKKLRRLKCKHIFSLHWKYTGLKFQFINFFYKILYYYKISKKFNDNFLINYGFLSFYYLEKNFFICNYIKKNFLLYKIYNLTLVKWYNKIFDYFNNDLNVSPHKFKNFSNPDVQKVWSINYIKGFKFRPLISPLFANFYDSKKELLVKSYYDLNLLSNNKLQINLLFICLWTIFNKLSFIKFLDIFSYNIDKFSIYNLFLSYKYSLEFIFWEILNSNNNFYMYYKQFLCFNYFLFNIQKDNILFYYLTKYFNSILNYLVRYSKDFFINLMFFFSFFCDFFFRIFYKKINNSNKSKFYFLKNKMNKYKYSIMYNNSFFFLTNKYINFVRYNLFFNKYENKFYKEYKFNFSIEYINQLKEVLREFKVLDIEK
jgi:hypothetical protein